MVGNRSYRLIVILIMSIAVLWSCSDNKGTDPVENYDDVIESGGSFQAVTEAADTTAPEVTIDTSGEEIYYCTRRTVNLVDAPDEYCTFDVNSTIIFPGNLLQGNSIANATPTPIPLKRGPGTIVMTVMNGAQDVSRTVDEISLSNVYNASNQILADNPGDLAAHSTYTMKHITSREQLGLELNVKYSNLNNDIQAGFKYKSDVSYSRYLVKLKQLYYTMAYQLPTTTSEIFDPSVTVSALEEFIYPGNPGTFISSVTYGRVFYLLIQSTSSKEEMEASVKASFDYGVHNTQIGVETSYVSELNELEIGGFALGGDASQAFGALQGDPIALKTYVEEGGTVTSGKPLSYVVNSLANPEQIVQVGIATEFDITDCVPVSQSIPNPLCKFRADDGVEYETCGGSDDKMITGLENLFGNSVNNANAHLEPGEDYAWAGNLIDDGSSPLGKTIMLYNTCDTTGSCEPTVSGQFDLNELLVEGTDFTILTVFDLPDSPPYSFRPFGMFRSGLGLDQFFVDINRNVGESANLFVSHRSPLDTGQVYTDVYFNTSGPVMLTIVFSQSEGVSIYEERLLRASLPGPLSQMSTLDGFEFSSGSECHNPTKLYEWRLYGSAIDLIQLDALYNEMRTVYGL